MVVKAGKTLDRRPEDWFPPQRSSNTPSSGDVGTAIDAALAAVDINTTAPLTGGGSLASDLTLVLNGTKAEFNASLSDGDFLYVGDVSGSVDDTIYSPSWDGVTTISPSKNAVYDKIELIAASIPPAPSTVVSDSAYGTGWNGVTGLAPSQNAVFDKIEALAVGGGGVTTFNTRSGDVVLTSADVTTALTFTPANVIHTHIISDVTGLQTALDGKQPAGSYAPLVHTHIIADVTGLQAALDGKALLVHTHAIADVVGLQAELDSKVDDTELAGYATDAELAAGLATKAPLVHTHIIADTTGLQAALDAKVDDTEMAGYVTDLELTSALANYSLIGHTHTIAQVTGLQAALDSKVDDSEMAAMATDAELAAGLATKAPLIHTHVIADVTGLTAALDAKVDDSELSAYATDAELTAGLANYVPLTQKGAANGVVPLNGSTLIDAIYLPSYVNDVIEVANYAALPVTGETGKIYVTLDTNAQYRWSGTVYVKLSDSAGAAVWGAITGTLSAQTDLTAALNGKAALVHTHVIADVTGLQAALDSKQPAGSYAPLVHTHVISDVTGLTAALDSKADDSDLAGYATDAELTAGLATKANTVHTHVPADILTVPTATVFYRKTAGTGEAETQTLATLKTDLGLTGNNTGDQTTIVGITGTLAQFNTACTDDNFAGLAAANVFTANQQLSLASPTLTFNPTSGSPAIDLRGTASTNDGIRIAVTAAAAGRIQCDTFTITNRAAGANYAVFSATGLAVTGTLSATGAISGSNLSGTNTGDQTTVSGNAGTATALQNSRNFSISGSGITAAAVGFNGTANVVLAASVDAGHVTLARMANLAANSFIGNNTGSAAVPVALTGTQATALLDNFTSTLKGLAPLSGGGSANFLRADGVWAVPPGGGASGVSSFNTRTGAVTLTAADVTAAMPAFTGDVTNPAGSVVNTITAKAVTLAKMADVATGTVFYRKTAAAGVPEVQTLATLKTDLGITGINSGDQTITLTGDVTGSGTGSFATTIAAGSVTYAKMANIATDTLIGRDTAGTGVPEAIGVTGGLQFNSAGSIQIANGGVTLAKIESIATARIIGRVSASSGSPESLTGTQATTLLDIATPSAKGVVLPPGGTTNYLRADGTWAVPPGSGGGVTSFNTRTGAVTLTSADVTGALTYTPVNKAGDTMSGNLTISKVDPVLALVGSGNATVSSGTTIAMNHIANAHWMYTGAAGTLAMVVGDNYIDAQVGAMHIGKQIAAASDCNVYIKNTNTYNTINFYSYATDGSAGYADAYIQSVRAGPLAISGATGLDLRVGNTPIGALNTFGLSITGSVNAKSSVPATNGYSGIMAGNTTNSGYLEVYAPDQTRASYIGFADSASVYIVCENNRQLILRATNYSFKRMSDDAVLMTISTNGLIEAPQFAGLNSSGTMAAGSQSASIEARSANSSSGAFMAFHTPGLRAVHMGLDADNQFKLGGWGWTNTRFRWTDAGNFLQAGNVIAMESTAQCEIQCGAGASHGLIYMSSANAGWYKASGAHTYQEMNAGGALRASGVIYSAGTRVFRHQSSAFGSGDIFVNTAAPSGGSDGDIWLQYV